MVHCCVPNCTSDTKKNQLGVTFHFFPKEINLREKWRIAVSRPGVKKGSLWSPTDCSKICSLHFLDTDFSVSTKNRRLLPNKVPSVYGCFPSHRQKTLTNNNDFPKRLHGKPINRKILKFNLADNSENNFAEQQRPTMEVSIKEEPGDPEEFLSEPGCSKSHAVWCVDDSKPNVNELSSDRVSIQPVCTKVENELEPDEFENVAIKEEMEDSESSRMSASVKSEIEDQHLECELKEEEEEDSDEFESQQFEEETLDIKEEGETSVKEDPLENPEEDKVVLETREEQSHPDAPQSCNIYKKSLARKTNVLEDKVVASGQNPYSCEVCGKSYVILSSLVKHKYVHRYSNICEICNKTFSTKSSLRRHMHTHNGDSPFSCDICGKSFNELHALRIHTRRHVRDLPYPCNCCDKKFPCKSDLVIHMRRIHNGKHAFHCEICGNLYNEKELLSKHLTTHTGELLPFSCKICNKAFIAKYLLIRHMTTHVENNSFCCKVCKKIFCHQSSLTRHMRFHKGDLPHSCDLCKKSFPFESDLEAHYLTHNVYRQFSCKICGKTFCHHSSLYRHMRFHKGDPPRSCDLCKKSFSCKSVLSRHIQTHSQFPCEICGKRVRKSMLNSHMLMHSKHECFSCEICNKSYPTRSNLRRHLLTHVGDTPFSLN